jgi:hypothetical protein
VFTEKNCEFAKRASHRLRSEAVISVPSTCILRKVESIPNMKSFDFEKTFQEIDLKNEDIQGVLTDEHLFYLKSLTLRLQFKLQVIRGSVSGRRFSSASTTVSTSPQAPPSVWRAKA